MVTDPPRPGQAAPLRPLPQVPRMNRLPRWRDVELRLVRSHGYLLATTWPDGRPHLMPVWGLRVGPASG
jgi:hypothetical protein